MFDYNVTWLNDHAKLLGRNNLRDVIDQYLADLFMEDSRGVTDFDATLRDFIKFLHSALAKKDGQLSAEVFDAVEECLTVDIDVSVRRMYGRYLAKFKLSIDDIKNDPDSFIAWCEKSYVIPKVFNEFVDVKKVVLHIIQDELSWNTL